MKTFRRSLIFLCLSLSVSLLSGHTLAQNGSQPGSELGPNASLSETLDWLDRNYFPRAWVSFETNREDAVFSQGFKLSKLDGCNLTLRNDNLDVLEFGTIAYPREYESIEGFRKRPMPDARPYPAELFIRLNRLDPEKGKRPTLRTKDPKQAKLYGVWRMKFEERRRPRRPQDVILLQVFYPPGTQPEGMLSYRLMFSFDEREMSEKFYAAFRQAIRLCAPK
jgi:hypothetical protein